MKWIDKTEWDFYIQWEKDKHKAWEKYFNLTHRSMSIIGEYWEEKYDKLQKDFDGYRIQYDLLKPFLKEQIGQFLNWKASKIAEHIFNHDVDAQFAEYNPEKDIDEFLSRYGK